MDKKTKAILRLGITAALLLLLLSVLDVRQLIESIGHMDTIYLFAAASLMPLMIFIKCVRWYLLARNAAVISFKDAVVSFLAGNALGALTPARMGELTRAAYLPVENRSRLAGLVMIDKIFDLLSFVMLALIGCVIFFGIEATVLLLAFLCISFIILFNMKAVNRLIQNDTRLSKVKLLGSLSEAVAIDVPHILLYQALALLTAIISIMQCYFLVNAFGPASMSLIVFTFPMIILTNIVPVTLSGLGVREGAAVMLLSQFGVSAHAAFSAAFLIYFIDNFVPGMFGTFFVSSLRLNTGKTTKT